MTATAIHRPPRIGSMFSGYGGLDIAVEQATGGRTVWVSDVDPGACAILARRFTGVPNLGDITTVDWSQVDPVDIICGGSPCQDLSQSGRRSGMHEGTRSNLWWAMREAIAHLKPQLVIWENVNGALSACASSASDSDLGPCPRCVDQNSGANHAPNIRALGRILGDLDSLGFDAEWVSLQASDVGACHGRRRVFIIAYPRGEHSLQRRLPAPSQEEPRWAFGELAGRDRTPLNLLPTPRASDGTKGGPNQRGSSGDLMLPSAVALLPTPSSADGLGGHEARGGDRGAERLLPVITKDYHHGRLLPTPSASNPNDDEDLAAWQDRRKRVKETAGNGNGFGTPLGVAVRLLPTPTATDSNGAGAPDGQDYRGVSLTDATVRQPDRWGGYAAAIARHERLYGPAPEPTEPTGKGGAHRLSPRFVEWMMCLPAGWVTDPDIWAGWTPSKARNAQLKALGNGVAPPQAHAAITSALLFAYLEQS